MINVTADYTLKNSPEKYPYLGGNSGCIVLFVGENEGVVLKTSTDNMHRTGYYSEFWDESKFSPISGTVTISNR